MPRLDAIRQGAKAAALAGVGGGAIAGTAAHYSGQDMGSSIKAGAMMGAGIVGGARSLSYLAGKGSAGLRKAATGLMGTYGGSSFQKGTVAGTRGAMSGSRALGNISTGSSRLSRAGTGMMAGGVAGLGYATLASNQNKTLGQSTLGDRLDYYKNLSQLRQ